MRPIRLFPILLVTSAYLLSACGGNSSSPAPSGSSSSEASSSSSISSEESSHQTGFTSESSKTSEASKSSEASHSTGFAPESSSEIAPPSSEGEPSSEPEESSEEESSEEPALNVIIGRVNGVSVELTNIHPEWDDYGVFSLTLAKGDIVTFTLDEEVLHFYSWPSGVETDLGDAYVALYEGDYTFGINQAKKIWFTAPEAPASEGNVMIFVNNVEINPRNIHPDWPDYGVYFITLNKGDKIRFYLDYELVHFYENDIDIGFEYSAIRDGEYCFGVNPSKQVWFVVPDPAITATVNGEPAVLQDIGSSDDDVKTVYRLNLEIDDKVRLYVEEAPMTLYVIEDAQEKSIGEEYTAEWAGDYLFTLKKNYKMFVTGPAIEIW